MKSLTSRIKKLEGVEAPGEKVDCIILCGKAHQDGSGGGSALALFVGNPALPELRKRPWETREAFDARLDELLSLIKPARKLPSAETETAFEEFTRQIHAQNARDAVP